MLEAAVEGRPWGRKRVEVVPKVQKVRSASSMWEWAALLAACTMGVEVTEGCDGGASAGEDVDRGEEGVEGASVG